MGGSAARLWRTGVTQGGIPCAATGRRLAAWLAAIPVLLLIPGGVTGAQDKAAGTPETFLGVRVTPLSGTYLVLKDVNVRAQPKTSSKRVGGLDKGERVEAAGKPKDAAWVGIRKGGKALGFVYAPMLLPLIDGTLKADIKGRAKGGGVSCRYTIHFDGRGAVEGELFETFDYQIAFDCEAKGRKTRFTAFMFITEGPFQGSRKPIYQITIDVRELGDALESAFSTVVMFERDKGRVVFDGVSLKALGAAPAQEALPAQNVLQALSRAVELALAAWNAKMWEALAKAAR